MGKSGRILSRIAVFAAVMALYALLLQGFLAGLAPAHAQAPIEAALCQHEARTPSRPIRDHSGQDGFCCTLSCGVAQVGPATLPGFEATIHREVQSAVHWRAEAAVGGPDKAIYAVSARGPPEV